MPTKRMASFKTPPIAITDRILSQNVRRTKVLEDQKRRRLQKVDSSRQLEVFANLHLGPSDDELENGDDQDSMNSNVPHQGVAAFAPLLMPTDSSGVGRSLKEYEVAFTGKKGKNTRNNNSNTKPSRRSKWADNCMYAELLEMNGDDLWSLPDGGRAKDGLPEDLESGWVAVSPVPIGKRCLAITHQSSGVAGIVPNTVLRSRVLGKSLMSRFPSSLPPLTILDCILDLNWHDNGILHVLDVLKWKGQDFRDCETPFRFWWRDTRLTELPQWPPPSQSALSESPNATIPHSINGSQPGSPGNPSPVVNRYSFPYPTSFIPIPYHTNTTFPMLLTHIIPLTRSGREVFVEVPRPDDPRAECSSGMCVNSLDGSLHLPVLESRKAAIHSDGLLLYVAQAGYEPGTTPLSSWIPIIGHGSVRSSADGLSTSVLSNVSGQEGPLDLFERLVKQRLKLSNSEMKMDIEME